IPANAPANINSGEWFTLEIIADGNRHRVLVDGKETLDFRDPASEFSGGTIALRLTLNSRLECRKIEIKELNVKKGATAPEDKKPADGPVVASDGFELLFNGKDMNAWKRSKQSPFWRIQDGIL